jgi:predicted nuclease with TOPRIM domain
MPMSIDSLKQLDERIQASVARILQLRQENERLVKQLAESEGRYLEASAELKQLHSECKQHEDERNEIRNRIEKILTRFDGLELG